ncbi:hypothetical protein PVIIG_01153 [Plasmodium vivax India VII]|uniref:Ribosome quality control complex subunit 2 n=1 Tax=Plasmodium vivax India VII TaxID=1077284 RepID=A0A0J9S681_PLAVI|nr:hypothetical protein PVIIG_01153 [Plasmodium vivax India VII]
MAKQRLTALDIRAIITLCRNIIVGCVVTNIYNISNKIYVLKCSKKEQKYFFLVEAEKRIHITEWKREKDVMPSAFTMKLRKHLRSRKITNISQLGGDRVVDIQFGFDDKACHLIVELYIAGNIILTDNNHKILSILKTNDAIGKKYNINDVYNVEEHTSIMLHRSLDVVDLENVKKSISEMMLLYNGVTLEDASSISKGVVVEGRNGVIAHDLQNNRVENTNLGLAQIKAIFGERTNGVDEKATVSKKGSDNNGGGRIQKGAAKNGIVEEAHRGGKDKAKNKGSSNAKLKSAKHVEDKTSANLNNSSNKKMGTPICSDNEKGKKMKKLKTLTDLASKLIVFAHSDLIVHSLIASDVNPSDLLEKYSLSDLGQILLKAINEALCVLNSFSSEGGCVKGYGFAPKGGAKCEKGTKAEKNKTDGVGGEGEMEAKEERSGEEIAFTEFSPIILNNHKNKVEENKLEVVHFDDFNKCVDTYFSRMELSKYDKQQEVIKIKKSLTKMDKIKLDHERRIDQLEKEVSTLRKKISLIQMNDELVEQAIQLMRAAVATNANWEKIWEHIKLFKKQNHPIALRISSVNFNNCEMELLLDDGEENGLGSDDSSEANGRSDDPSSEANEQPSKGKKSSNKKAATNNRFAVTINLNNSVYGNVEDYQKLRKKAEEKIRKTKISTNFAVKKVEKKKKEKENKQKGKHNKTVGQIQKIRKVYWFEKFHWFISSENYLVIAGRDALQNEILFRRYFQKNDVYVHADIHGASTCIIKNPHKDIPIPEKTLSEAGQLAICRSSAWNNKIITSAWWVHYHQVSKSAPTGEYLKTGSFVIRGKKNYLPHVKLEMGLCIIFQMDNAALDNNEENNLDDTQKSFENDGERRSSDGDQAVVGGVTIDACTAEGHIQAGNPYTGPMEGTSFPATVLTRGRHQQNGGSTSAKCTYPSASNECFELQDAPEGIKNAKGVNSCVAPNVPCRGHLKRCERKKRHMYNRFVGFFLPDRNRTNLLNKNFEKKFDRVFPLLEKLGIAYNHDCAIVRGLLSWVASNLWSDERNYGAVLKPLMRGRNGHLSKCGMCAALKRTHKRLLLRICNVFVYFFLERYYPVLKEHIPLGDPTLRPFLRRLKEAITFFVSHRGFAQKGSYTCLSLYLEGIPDMTCTGRHDGPFEGLEDTRMVSNAVELKKFFPSSFTNGGSVEQLGSNCVKDYLCEGEKRSPFIFVECAVYGAPPVTFKDEDSNDSEADKKVKAELGDHPSVSSHDEKRECGEEEEKAKRVSFVSDHGEEGPKLVRPARSRKCTGFVKMDVSKLLQEIEEEEEEEHHDEEEGVADATEETGTSTKVTLCEAGEGRGEKKSVTFTSEDESVGDAKQPSLNVPRPVRTRKPTGFVKMDVSKLLQQIGDEQSLEDVGEDNAVRQVGQVSNSNSELNEEGAKGDTQEEVSATFGEGPRRPSIRKKSVSFSSEDEHIYVERQESLNVPRPVRSRKPTGYVKMDVRKLLEEIENEEKSDEGGVAAAPDNADETSSANHLNGSNAEDEHKEETPKVTFAEGALSPDLKKKSVSFSYEDVYMQGEKNESLNAPRPVRSRKPTGFVKMDVSKLLEEIDLEENSDDGEEGTEKVEPQVQPQMVTGTDMTPSDNQKEKKVTFTGQTGKSVSVKEPESPGFSRPARPRKATGFVKMDLSKLLEDVEGGDGSSDGGGAPEGKKNFDGDGNDDDEEDEDDDDDDDGDGGSYQESEESDESDESDESNQSASDDQTDGDGEDSDSDDSHGGNAQPSGNKRGGKGNNEKGSHEDDQNGEKKYRNNSNKQSENEVKKNAAKEQNGSVNQGTVKDQKKDKSCVHLLRGARTKKKRMKKKYREQNDDEEERQLHMKIIGARKMKHETEKAKVEKLESKAAEQENKYKSPKEVTINFEEINEEEMKHTSGEHPRFPSFVGQNERIKEVGVHPQGRRQLGVCNSDVCALLSHSESKVQGEAGARKCQKGEGCRIVHFVLPENVNRRKGKGAHQKYIGGRTGKLHYNKFDPRSEGVKAGYEAQFCAKGEGQKGEMRSSGLCLGCCVPGWRHVRPTGIALVVRVTTHLFS